MSWEIDSINKYPCPCGEGEYEVIAKSDDWFRTKEEYTMLCEKCKGKYFYKEEIIGGHKGNFRVRRGWVLKEK